MKYASTATADGAEAIVEALPLSAVPLWDPAAPVPGTYLVDDGAQPGWVRQGETFVPPAPEGGEGEGGGNG